MKKFSIPGIIATCLFFQGCYKNEFVDFSYRNDSEINVYLVKDGQIEQGDNDIELNNLELEKMPWISRHEIYFYDWSAHIFYLKDEKPREKYSGRYFLVKENNEPLFPGYFFPPYMSSFPPYPAVIASDYLFYPMDVVSIGGFGGYFDETMDENTKFKNALKKSGLFREGISVKLTGVKRKNSSTVEYTFEVTNLDKENIYVLDPDKMGPDRFHYYTNGVSFFKGNTNYFPENIQHTPSDNIPLSWYYRLSPGRSLTRTVELGGFQTLPEGNCICTFSFPGKAMNKTEWKMRDGRIWLGDYFINKELNF